MLENDGGLLRREGTQRETEVLRSLLVNAIKYIEHAYELHGLGTTATNADERPTIARTSRTSSRPLLFVSFFLHLFVFSDSETFSIC